ncbi:M23/M56 family metallopeptidase [uncultured Maricaulis sp.]|uniref:M23/M56 family metallopeptidase n=1 Tax=uncultured Maricaulis sp. TaxID=174710 RepID=UPI0030DA6A13|tara:strand:+ start:96951 stop:98489 length:1539 start_codon:yes stop_codon:yes gene_type:complete
MSGFLTALLIGAALTLPAAGLAWLAGLALQARTGQSSPALWRSARLVAILPLLLTPLLYAIPQTLPPMPALEFIDETALDLPAAVPVRDALTATPAALTLPSLEIQLAAVYAIGLIASLLLALRRHHHRRRLLARSRIADASERILLDREAGKLALPAPELRLCSSAASPFLTGWRGVIVAPERLLQTPELARHALVHELCHLRRGDERDRLLGSALTIALWFNWPLRQVERELDAAREIACDSDAIQALGRTQCKAYAATLIETMRSSAQPVSAFGPYNRRQREMRIKAILSGGQTVRHSLLTAGAVLILAIPVACAQATVTPRRVVSAPVEQIAPQTEMRVIADTITVQHPVPGTEGPGKTIAEGRVRVDMASGQVDFVHRVLEGRVTSGFGQRPSRPLGANRFHGGTDIGAPEGTDIHVPAAGVVTHAEMGFEGSDNWGNTVVVDHGDGWSTLYAHMSSLAVEPGEVLSIGSVLGTVGQTGIATGPHLHVEVRHEGERVDPADYLTGLR